MASPLQPSKIPPPSNLLTGGILPKLRVYGEQSTQLPDSEFNTTYERQSSLDELSQQQSNGANVTAKEARETKPPHLHVKIRVYRKSIHDHASHVDVEFTFSWPERGGRTTTQVVLRVDRRNLASRVKISELSERRQLPRAFDTVPDEHLNLGEDTCLVKINYNAACIMSTGILGIEDFGPFSDWMRDFRSWVVHGGTLYLATDGFNLLQEQIEQVNRAMKLEAKGKILHRHWEPEPTPTVNMYYDNPEYCVERVATAWEPGTNYATPATVSYRDKEELMTVEVVGLKRHREWEISEFELQHERTVRFAQVPHDDNRLIMLVKTHLKDKLVVEDGDEIKVRIPTLDPLDAEEPCWRGEPCSAPQLERADERSFILTRQPRQIDKDTGELGGADVSNLKFTFKATYDVTILLSLDFKSFERSKEIYVALGDWIDWEEESCGSSAILELISCNRFDRLPTFNLLSLLSRDNVTKLRDGFSDEQCTALDSLRAMPCGVAIVHGCAGSGKTYFVRQVLKAMFDTHCKDSSALNDLHGNSVPLGPDVPCIESTSNNLMRQGLRVLLTSTANGNAEDLHMSSRKDFEDVNPSALVIRRYNQPMMKKILAQRVRGSAGSMNAARQMIQESKFLTRDTFKTEDRYYDKDRRVTEGGLYHCSAIYLLIALEIEEPTPDIHSQPATDRLRKQMPLVLKQHILEAIRNFKISGGSLSVKADTASQAQIKAIQRFCIAIDQGFNWLHSIADAIVVTCQQAMDITMTQTFKPTIIVGDEFGKASPAESLCWTWYPTCKVRIFVGDPYQSRVQCRSNAVVNSFFCQQELSLLTRLILAGFPCVTSISEQYRYCPEIARLIGGAFYNGILTTSTSARTRPGVDRFRKAAQTLFGHELAKNVILVSARDTTEQKNASTGSKSNPETAIIVHEIIARLRTQSGYKDTELGIISPYVSQRILHQSVHDEDPGATGGAMLIETAERAIGRQTDVLIYDLTSAQHIGFASEEMRLCTGLTRARDGLIIVADVNSLYWDHEMKYKGRVLKSIFDDCRDQGQRFKGFSHNELKDSVYRKLVEKFK